VKIAIVYDNNPYDSRLRTAWGFSCLIEYRGQTVLFDTGGDTVTLLSNMSILGLDPKAIEMVVLSHIHGDHTGGLGGILAAGARPVVYVPRSFPARFKEEVRGITDLREVTGPEEIHEGIYTTGEMGSGIREQALALRTKQGLVVITGCAHPGVERMVRRAKEIAGGNVYLVLGGFHLGAASEKRIKRIVSDFRQMDVRKVAPCHCTGGRAMKIFADEFGEDFIRIGAGSILYVRE